MPIQPGQTFGQFINQLTSGSFHTMKKIRPCGALQVRKQASGVSTFYWRYSLGGASERVTVGLYDPSASPKSITPTTKGLSFMAAVRAAEALALEHHQNLDMGGRPAVMASRAAAAEAAATAKLREADESFAWLMEDYADHLQKLGRNSHSDVRSITKNHIVEPWPKLAALPAREVSSEQVADVMRRVASLGKGRTANKLRSYVRAAYQTARSARSKASVDEKFKRFEIRSNPAAETDPDESQNRSDKNPLSTAQLQEFWRRIEFMPGFKGAALRLYLLTGGQRLAQLVRIERGQSPAGTIVLMDGKGRPGKEPRLHYVPLIPAAEKALKGCCTTGKYVFSTDDSQTHLAATTLSDWACQAAEGIEDFQTKRIRSGVETALARVKVSREFRGRLQSHGISGVQARHYDDYDYLAEKREALELLYSVLTAGAVSNA